MTVVVLVLVLTPGSLHMVVVVVVGGRGGRAELGRERQVEVLGCGLVVLGHCLRLLDVAAEMSDTVAVVMVMITVGVAVPVRVPMPMGMSMRMSMRVILSMTMRVSMTM